MSTFDQASKIEGAAKFIQVMHETAGCSAAEIKQQGDSNA